MAKISANYEVVFIMDGRLPEEQVAALTEKFKTLVEQNSTAMEVEEWASASWPTPSTTSPKATMF